MKKFSKIIPILVIFFGVFFFVQESLAATYYVKTSSCNDLNNSGLDDAHAWCHCPGMAGWAGTAILRPGDIVYFRNSDTWTGLTGPAILDTKAGVTYDGDSWGAGSRARIQKAGNNAYFVIQVIESGVTVKGFEVDGAGYDGNGIEVNGYTAYQNIKDITIDNCVVHNIGSVDNYWYGIGVGSFNAHTTTNVTVSNCKVYDTVHEAIVLYPSWQQSGNVLSNVVVRGCEVYNTGRKNSGFGSGIDVKDDVRGAVIEFNYIHDNPAWGMQINTDSSQPPPSNIIVRHNIIKDNGNYGLYSFHVAAKADIYGNLFINNGKSGSSRGGNVLIEGAMGGSNFKFYNNLLFSGANGAANKFGFANWGSGAYSIEFRNNLAYSNVAGLTPVRDDGQGSKLTHGNNLIFNVQGASAEHVNNGTSYNRAGVKTWEPTAQNTDPLFVNVANLPTAINSAAGPNTNGLSLQSTSPAINTGIALGNPYNNSVNLVSRPQGSAYDIGAYEYLSGIPQVKKGDLNSDSKVDIIDLGIFLSNWGATTKPASDINQDGKVDIIDLGILLSNWG